MVLEVYASMGSPPCRFVYTVLKHLNIPYEQKQLNMRDKEHLQPQFLELNPFHTIPTIVDDGFPLFESRAIATYLIEKYAPDNHLYPHDLHKRASINRWLFWETASLAFAVRNYMAPTWRGEAPDPKAAEPIVKHVGTLDSILSKSKYIAGDNVTLADIAIAPTILNIKAHKLEVDHFDNVNNWLKRLESDLANVWAELFVQPIEDMKKRMAERAAAKS